MVARLPLTERNPQRCKAKPGVSYIFTSWGGSIPLRRGACLLLWVLLTIYSVRYERDIRQGRTSPAMITLMAQIALMEDAPPPLITHRSPNTRRCDSASVRCEAAFGNHRIPARP
jgi:hypothetical protein